MANQKYTGMKILLTAVVTGAVNGGDTINYTLATTATQFSWGTIYCCDFRS
jgi:hypothetical protein